MSFTEKSATPSRNPSPRQLDHSSEILPCIKSLQQALELEGITLEKFLIRIRILNQTHASSCDSDLQYKSKYWAKHTLEKFGNSLGISIVNYIF